MLGVVQEKKQWEGMELWWPTILRFVDHSLNMALLYIFWHTHTVGTKKKKRVLNTITGINKWNSKQVITRLKDLAHQQAKTDSTEINYITYIHNIPFNKPCNGQITYTALLERTIIYHSYIFNLCVHVRRCSYACVRARMCVCVCTCNNWFFIDLFVI